MFYKWHYFILFCGGVVFISLSLSLSLHTYTYILFILLPVSGHLGLFHFLAIVNSVSMNTGVGVSFQIRGKALFLLFSY